MTFQPGQSGNPAGRPRGSRNRRTIVAEKLLDDRAGELTEAAIGLATGGDAAALRVCMDRVTPPVRHRPVEFALPTLDTAADAVAAADAIAQGAARGELTVQEAAGLMKIVKDFVLVVHAADLERRVAQLERDAGDKDEERDADAAGSADNDLDELVPDPSNVQDPAVA